MRSSFLVLLAVALVLAAFAPVASADVNLTIWNDKQCTQSAQVATIPCSSTLPPTCVKDPSSQSSGTFYCSSVGGSNNITWAIWASVSDCSGTPDETLISYGPDNTCGTLIVTAQGQTYQIPATITNLNSSSSSSSSSKAKAAPATPLTALLNTAKYATAKTPARLGARRGLDKLFGRKQLNAL